jgi:hypothetical protein
MNPFQQSMVRMRLPEGMGGTISVRGFTMDADDEGCVMVPQDVAADLVSHGLTPPSEPTPAKAKK